MLLTVFSLLSYLVLIISAAPGYVQEKRPGYSSSYYPGRKNVSPRSVAINNRYPHAIRTRNPQGGGGGHKHHYGGPPPILQTATTLINVHPTNGYRKCPPDANQDDCNPPARMSVVEPPSTLPPPPPQTEPPMQTEPPHPTTTPCPKTTTTTELNIYQGNNKVVELRARLPTDAPAYPTYQPPPPPPPPVYQPPPPPVYQPPPPPPPPRYVPPPPRYTPPPPPEVTEAPYHRPGETVIRIGPKDDDYGKKKYKVLICKLQKD